MVGHRKQRGVEEPLPAPAHLCSTTAASPKWLLLGFSSLPDMLRETAVACTASLGGRGEKWSDNGVLRGAGGVELGALFLHAPESAPMMAGARLPPLEMCHPKHLPVSLVPGAGPDCLPRLRTQLEPGSVAGSWHWGELHPH